MTSKPRVKANKRLKTHALKRIIIFGRYCILLVKFSGSECRFADKKAVVVLSTTGTMWWSVHPRGMVKDHQHVVSHRIENLDKCQVVAREYVLGDWIVARVSLEDSTALDSWASPIRRAGPAHRPPSLG